MYKTFANASMRELLVTLFFLILSLGMIVILVPISKKQTEEVCVGNCPPPGPMDCTIYGRKPDGSWPSGFECSATP